MGETFVSIIVPIYNSEIYLGDAIESVFKQTYQNYELLLINDGSTDRSGEICRKYKENREYGCHIRYFKKKNSGVSETRNFGIRAAHGDYIMFLDSDDLLPRNAVEVYVGIAKEVECDAIFASHYYKYGEKLLPRKSRKEKGIYSYQDVASELLDDGTLTGILFGSVWGAFYNAEAIRQNEIAFQNDVKVNEDGLFNIQFLKASGQFVVSEQYTYIYRQWRSEKRSKIVKDKRFETSEPILAEILGTFDDSDIYKIQFLRRKVSVAFWNAIRVGETEQNYARVKDYLKELFLDNDVKASISTLDYFKMNRYKKIFVYLMAHNHSFFFYILIKYIRPFFSGIMVR